MEFYRGCKLSNEERKRITEMVMEYSARPNVDTLDGLKDYVDDLLNRAYQRGLEDGEEL